jgi:hypothetical protein
MNHSLFPLEHEEAKHTDAPCGDYISHPRLLSASGAIFHRLCEHEHGDINQAPSDCGDAAPAEEDTQKAVADPLPERRGAGSSCVPFTHISSNPHCTQRLFLSSALQLPEPKFVPFSALQRTLNASCARLTYRHIQHSVRSTNHWGQRKLLLSEIEFLLMFVPQLRARCPPPKRIVILYAGAAPGTHIPYLFNLFNNKSGDLQFVLFDPAYWNIWPSSSLQSPFPQISICPPEAGSPNGFFNDDVARCSSLQSATSRTSVSHMYALRYYRALCEEQGFALLFIR